MQVGPRFLRTAMMGPFSPRWHHPDPYEGEHTELSYPDRATEPIRCCLARGFDALFPLRS